MKRQAATAESIAKELEQRMDVLLTSMDENPSPFVKGVRQDFKEWFLQTFFIERSTTPKGGKAIKEEAKKLLWFATNSTQVSARQVWNSFKPIVSQFVSMFAEVQDSTQNIMREHKTSLAVYRNDRGLANKTFLAYVHAIEQIFKSLKGWRAKALQGRLTVSFAGAEKFRGTSAGKYKMDEDVLLVRATPAIMKRSPGKYGSPDYILVHELGHRYDHKIGAGVDFQRTPWYTTKYSRTDGFGPLGEAFAELFALGHFGIRNVNGDFGPVIDKFEALMQGKEKAELHTATQRLVAVQRIIQHHQASASIDFERLREKNLRDVQDQHPELDRELLRLQDSEYFEEAINVTEAIASAAYELGYVEHSTEVPPWLKKLGKVFKVDVKKLCAQGRKDAE